MKKLLFLLPIILYAQVIDTIIPLFDQPRERFLYIPEGNKLYINLDQSGRLLVLDCSTYAIRNIIQLPPNFPSSAYGVWNQRRNKIYYTFSISPESIAVIDNQTDSIIKWINFYSIPPPCYNSKDDKIYVSDGASVAVIDCETDSIIKIIPPSPYNLAVLLWDSIDNKLYCGGFPDKVIVINCANDSIIAVINSRVSSPAEAVYNLQRRKVYVGGEQGQTGAVIDAIGDTLIKNFHLSFAADFAQLVWNNLEDKVYWTGYNHNIYIIDCLEDSIIDSLYLPGGVIFDGLRLDHLNNRLYFASLDTVGTGYIHILLKVLDCHNDSIISQISFGRFGIGMEYDPINQRIYIGDAIDSALYVIRDEIPGIEEHQKLDTKRLKPEIYPNPIKCVLRVRGPLSEKSIKIFDASGRLIKEIATTATQSRNDGAVAISLKGMNPGIYFLRLGKQTKKFLVVK